MGLDSDLGKDLDNRIKTLERLADKNTDEILGVHMLGPRCSDMIGQAVIAMEYKASAEDVATIVHAHPTFRTRVSRLILRRYPSRQYQALTWHTDGRAG